MTNGNDMVIYIEGCEECQKLDDEYYDDDLNLTKEEKLKIGEKIYDCFCNSFNDCRE